MKIVLFLSMILTAGLAMALPSQIIIIRHGEKPDTKSEDLSEKGFERAEALTRLFQIHPDWATNGTANFIFATKYVEGNSSRRTYQTVTPLARSLNLPIHDEYLTEDYADLAKDLLTNPVYQGRSILIAWTHTYIVPLAQALGSAPQTKWKSSVFDRAWVIRYDSNDRATSRDFPQRLLPGDSNN